MNKAAKIIDQIIQRYHLEPLAGEGGYWAPIHRNEFGNAIYFLLTRDEYSAWHKLEEHESWVHLDGAPLDLYQITTQLTEPNQLSLIVQPGKQLPLH